MPTKGLVERSIPIWIGIGRVSRRRRFKICLGCTGVNAKEQRVARANKGLVRVGNALIELSAVHVVHEPIRDAVHRCIWDLTRRGKGPSGVRSNSASLL